MKKTIIYFMRHGEVYNPKDILYGRLPGFNLSESGRKKVIIQAGQLKKEGIEAIYSSPLLRTRQTAAIIAGVLKIKPIISYLLIEVRLIIQGMPLLEFRKSIQPDIYDKKYTLRGQESIEEIQRRISRFLRLVLKKHSGKKILVVSHGDPIVILKAYTSGLPFTYKYKKDNYLQTGEWIKLIVSDGKYIWQ